MTPPPRDSARIHLKQPSMLYTIRRIIQAGRMDLASAYFKLWIRFSHARQYIAAYENETRSSLLRHVPTLQSDELKPFARPRLLRNKAQVSIHLQGG